MRLLVPFPVAAPPRLTHPLAASPPPRRVARLYQVSYQLKRATMYLGRVKTTFLVPCTRRFPTNELTVILAELYEEIGPAHDLLGIEILTIRSLPATV
jgi:hypothetical protein